MKVLTLCALIDDGAVDVVRRVVDVVLKLAEIKCYIKCFELNFRYQLYQEQLYHAL